MYTIIYYFHDQPLHLDVLRNSNPASQILSIHTKHDLPRNTAWRNPDRILRSYLKTHFNAISHENIFFVEYDVFINIEIPMMNLAGLYSKYKLTPETGPRWCWWREIDLMPQEFRQHATGCPIFSLLGISRTLLKEILNSDYDAFFDLDVHCELRFATLVRALGYPQFQFDPDLVRNLVNTAKAHQIEPFISPTFPGILHPVKKRLDAAASPVDSK